MENIHFDIYNNLTEIQNILCNLCGNVLFERDSNVPEDFDLGELFTEAKNQTVFPIAYMGFKNKKYDKAFYNFVAKNVQVNYNHTEIADLLSANNIKYVFIKGVASASYYKEPTLRMMGDVDILINRYDIEKVHALLQTLGYNTNEDIFKENGHMGYKREISGILSICEVHFVINGIPDSLADVFERYIGNILDNTKEITVANGRCLVPNDFHHGVVLLLHTANHLTNEGVGLRHLCDWAVFANSFSNDEFVNLFEAPLKEMGLWRFAQLLTLCCVKYLGCDKKEWAGEQDDLLLDSMIADILMGGNFGYKDKDRYGQIKYISDREAHKVSDKGTFLQLLSNINAKAKAEYSFSKNCKLLLPIAWILVIFNYFVLVLTRKRKLDNIKTINSAKYRQSLYSEFKLFEKNE